MNSCILSWARTGAAGKKIAVLQSFNAPENGEPHIFTLVKLQVAREHYDNFGKGQTEAQTEEHANSLSFLTPINTKLSLINLKARIKLLDKRNWRYEFTLCTKFK
jgi:hypothetical protein